MGIEYDDDGELYVHFWYRGTLVGNEGAEAYEGPLRAKIRLGETFVTRSGGPTDEGYSYTETIYDFYDHAEWGPVLVCRISTEARDCDGRLDTFGRYRAIELEAHRDYYDKGVLYPVWEKMKLNRGEYAQRDYTAEAAGY